MRRKIAARGTSWHGLILGGLDCAGRMGLGFRPGPETHVLDTLGVQIPRCEDLTRTRKDRAYAFRWGGQAVSPFRRRRVPAPRPGTASSFWSGGTRRRPPTALCRRWFSQRSAPLRRSRALADKGPRRVRPPCCN